MMKQLVTLTMLVAVVALASSVQADTVGYWRFEDSPGLLQDSSTYDNDLTSHGNPVHYTLPTTGRGANFDDPIPQTNAANAKAVDLDGDGDYYSCADQTEFAVSDFTIELYVRRDNTDNVYFASQYDSSASNPNQRSWTVMCAGTGLRLYVSESGTSGVLVNPNISIAANTDYFIAVSFDESDTTSGVNFYVKDLSAGTWTTVTRGHTITSLHNTTADFRIGAAENGGAALNGVIDEVRFSNDVLSQDDLLASVPEPATMTLLLLGLPLALRRRRK